ncbi:flagellar hook assembly protein FlgD [Glaciimonas soli]|uniref:Basal-body rod modification protein FlgD n=1 Tax=Glaciimonas soli TaxID=2590999 RepID=A0A843YNV8_9BURK|nr:flagellar hook assembly protein FlgD [Glaciimonas soli]MQQ99463.1 flagellar biosynthesis protein FlgD [Glaciimonas soli]
MNVNGFKSDSLSTGGVSGNGTGSASEKQFLKLMITQMQNQDPLNPLDNAQLTSQLAQMATVSGVEELNGRFGDMLAQDGFTQALQASNLIGKEVLVPGSDVKLGELGGKDDDVNAKSSEGKREVKFGLNLDGAADGVVVKITNDKGEVVRTIDRGALPAGVDNMVWNGLGDDGQPLPSGDYKIAVTATNAGSKVEAAALKYAKVDGVSFDNKGVWLDLAGSEKARLADIRWIV